MPPRKRVIHLPPTTTPDVPLTPAGSTTSARRAAKPAAGAGAGMIGTSVPVTPITTARGSGSDADSFASEGGKGNEEEEMQLDSDDLDGEAETKPTARGARNANGNGHARKRAAPPSDDADEQDTVFIKPAKPAQNGKAKQTKKQEDVKEEVDELEESAQAAPALKKPRLSLPTPPIRPSLPKRTTSTRSQNPLSRLTTPSGAGVSRSRSQSGASTPWTAGTGSSIGEHDSRNELEGGGSGEEREAWEEFAGDDSELVYSSDESDYVKPTRTSAQKKKGTYKLPSLSPSASPELSDDPFDGGGGFVVEGSKKGKVAVRGKGKAAVKPRQSTNGKAKHGGKVDNPYEVDSDSDAEVKMEDELDVEAAMIKSAMKASLADMAKPNGEGSRRKAAGAGRARNKEAEKRAKAVEKRLGIKKDPDSDAMDLDSDESEFQASSDLSEPEFPFIDDSDEDSPSSIGLAEVSNKKGRGKKSGGGVGDPQRVMESLELRRKKRKEEKAARDEELKEVRELERALKKKLGRKLTWGEKNQVALTLHHPEIRDVWGDLQAKIGIIKPVPMEAHPSLKLTLLPFQKESLYWMKKQEEGPWKGGMLADEMGMGKTIQTIALLLSEPRNKPSLVIAPVVALMQWKHEIETHAEGFTVCLWHGQSRIKGHELKKFDVVLTSYGTLEAAFRKQQRGFKKKDVFIKEKSPMHSFQWYRIVLDEAHNIKERSTNAAKAAFALDGKYKWCLSGTPLQNRVGELYSLIRFLNGDPFAYYFCKRCPCKSLHWQFTNKRECDDCGHSPMMHCNFWSNEILTPIQKNAMSGPGEAAFKKLKILLDRMMLRRTKIERADDLGLPPRTIVIRRDYFSPEEKELYMGLFQDTQRQFSTYIAAGTVLNNYSNVFALITRMRQMACHPDLVLRSKTAKYIEDATEQVVCRICNDTAEDAIVSKCHHVFDRACIRDYLESSQKPVPDCPVCHLDLSIDLEAEAIEIEEDGTKRGRQGILGRLDIDNWRSSTKLEVLVEELSNLREQDCTIKSLVFSQFVSFLDLIAFRLQKAGFNICRLEGGMTPQARDNTIQHFMKNPQVTVFLVSLKAGGVALNLTEASRVYLMDSWWNPSVEYQAMDRIHRLGQHRPVTVVKLVVQDSIESKIVQLQEKKLQMMTAALAKDGEQAMGRLTPEDLQFLFKL